jgi:hypothetical protein
MPAGERPLINAMIEYHKGRCSEADFDRAEAVLDRVRTGAAAMREYNAFLEAAGGVSPVTPELQSAIDDAPARVPAIQQRIRG